MLVMLRHQLATRAMPTFGAVTRIMNPSEQATAWCIQTGLARVGKLSFQARVG